MKLKQTQKLVQTLALTPAMRQSLRVLRLSVLELKEYVDTQIEENPALEAEENREQLPLPMDTIEKLVNTGLEPEQSFLAYTDEELNKKADYQKSLITQSPTLGDHLLKQLGILSLNAPQYKIGEFIIGSINENGYLNISLHEITNAINKKNTLVDMITKKDVEEVLAFIHTFDPPGIGARNLKECLLLQLRYPPAHSPLAYKIIKYHLSDLLKHKLKVITKKLKVSLESLNSAIEEIASLEPKPGRAFMPSINQYIPKTVPDVIVENIDGKYEIIINNKEVPKLKVSHLYLELLKSDTTPKETKKYIQERIRSALNLMQAIVQRENTLIKMVTHLLKIHKDFFEYGERVYIKPLTLKAMAKIIGRNESTVSRMVHKKYIKTPFGIYCFDYFFAKGMETLSGQNISDELIKTKILHLIEDESLDSPLKDNDIAKILNKEGIKIARRTIAKYREDLKIPPSHKRKKKSK